MTEAKKPAAPPLGPSRLGIVQALLNACGGGDYLEIGVNRGTTFLKVRAKRKVAVDPTFLFDTTEAAAADPTATFHALISDAYFAGIIRPAETFDVIFLDGLHTFDQTLRDFCNAIGHLAPGGVIVIDDVSPSDYEATLPDQNLATMARRRRDPEDRSGAWMGDVYRLLFFIEAYFQQWSLAAVAPRGNQLVVWRERRPRTKRRRVEKIADLPYERTLFSRASYRLMPLDEVVGAVRRAAGEAA